MKLKLKFLIFLISISILITGCTKPSEIDYQLVFKGFVALEDDGREFPPAETLVFENEEQWNDFTSNYLDSLQYILGKLDKYVDFSNGEIIYACKIIMPASGRFNSSAILEKVTLNDNVLDIKWAKDDIYIVNLNEKTIYPFVLLVKIRKNKNLSNLKNIYKKAAQ
ncbi:hypothetical protein [Caloranaerobacter sp. DY30410]|uniref:hypothetical protein n=1 Tax=Caloranaerobacter sp. DY30410 TaxID=3238305 RepID=UPI003D039BBF